MLPASSQVTTRGNIDMGSEADLADLWSRLLAKGGALSETELTSLGDSERTFWRIYAPLMGDSSRQGMVVGQIGQSLDGRIATSTGKSHYINGPEAITHLHRLRALVDAVVVGIGTVLTDNPQLTVRAVAGPCPARVVIDPRGRLPETARLLAEDGIPVYVVGSQARPAPPRAVPIEVPARNGCLDPPEIIAALAERGLRRLLIEGGAYTLSTFLAANALDRLHICVAPLLIGSGPTGLDLPAVDRLEDAWYPHVALYRMGRDVLFDCEFANSREKSRKA
jgi:diaminohydroxyphosphoribosylaminopyrimidine deaminase / 5-amino-6-(5-phosphoribosylamino)uracil reductase